MTLFEKLEAATEGSRELDVLLWAHFDNREVFEKDGVILARHREPPHDTCRLGTIDPGKNSRNFQEAWSKPPFPRLTTSIDAALALVERKGWRPSMISWSVELLTEPHHRVTASMVLPDDKGWPSEGYSQTQGTTVPLAIMTALVKAEASS